MIDVSFRNGHLLVIKKGQVARLIIICINYKNKINKEQYSDVSSKAVCSRTNDLKCILRNLINWILNFIQISKLF